MTDATVSVSPITITTYITYYSVSTTQSMTLQVSFPINSSVYINDSTIEVTAGITVPLLYSLGLSAVINDLDYIEALAALSYISFPSLGSNTRTTVSNVDDQKIDIVKSNRDVVETTLVSYVQANGNIDSLPDITKKYFYNEVIKTVKNRASAQYVIRSSVNKYGR